LGNVAAVAWRQKQRIERITSVIVVVVSTGHSRGRGDGSRRVSADQQKDDERARWSRSIILAERS
jgi:hypothetical protein